MQKQDPSKSLHKAMIGDACLAEEDPHDEEIMRSWLASLERTQEAGYRRQAVAEEGTVILRRRNAACASTARRSRPRARGAGRPGARRTCRTGDSGGTDPADPDEPDLDDLGALE